MTQAQFMDYVSAYMFNSQIRSENVLLQIKMNLERRTPSTFDYFELQVARIRVDSYEDAFKPIWDALKLVDR